MSIGKIFFVLIVLYLPELLCKQNFSTPKNWREILLIVDDSNNSLCYSSKDSCPKSAPYNNSSLKKPSTEKVDDRVNASDKIVTPPEKAIESFDEWTKKRRDAAANQVNVHQQQQIIKGGVDVNTIGKTENPAVVPIAGPTRNFASKECGAKVIASNPEAENAKSIVNEKDVDDYMRNPCQSAKEKFVVIELCEAIQVKKFSIGNFELFASRPKQISVEISDRYPPLSNWVSLGTFQLQDHHKILQSFEVPHTNIYAKFVRINLEDHYGKEHYCIVSVVNVMGTTLSDEYEKEEAAVHLMNSINSDSQGSGVVESESITTPPPSEQSMPTQLPTPPKAKKLNSRKKINKILKSCNMSGKQQRHSHLLCHVLPVRSDSLQMLISSPIGKQTGAPMKSDAKKTSRMMSNRTSHVSYDQSRRRNLASIQRLLSAYQSNTTPAEQIPSEKEKVEPVMPTVTPVPNAEKEPIAAVKQDVEKEKLKNEIAEKTNVEADKNVKVVEPVITPTKQESIVPAGGSTSQREMVLMKLSKRIAAVELNLTLSTEYLSELSKQYVSQMSGYQQELKETRRASKESARAVESLLWNKMNSVRREMRELKQSIKVLQQLEQSRSQQSQYEMTRSIFVPSCHMTAPLVPPQPILAQLPQIIPGDGEIPKSRLLQFEEKWKRILERAQSVVFGSFSWNTDHLIVALIATNIIVVALLFAGIFYTNRRNRERCEDTQTEMRNEMRRRVGKLMNSNRKLIFKGLRRAELAVTAAVTSNLKIEKNDKNRKAVGELETALSNLFAIHQSRIDEQFEENQKLLKSVLETKDRCSKFNDTMSIEDSESSSETEHQKEDTPTCSNEYNRFE